MTGEAQLETGTGTSYIPIVVAARLLPNGSARNHQSASNVLVRSLGYWPRRLSDMGLSVAAQFTG